MVIDKEMRETKAEFNKRYGRFMREIRENIAQSVENVTAATGVDINALRAIENGQCVELYDAMRLCKYYGVEDAGDV